MLLDIPDIGAAGPAYAARVNATLAGIGGSLPEYVRSSGGDDLANIEAAIGRIPALGTVVLSDTDYQLSDSLSNSGKPFNLVSGARKSTIVCTGATRPGLSLTGTGPFALRDVKLVGPQYAAFHGNENAIQIIGASADEPFVGLTLDGFESDSWGEAGLWLQYVNDIVVGRWKITNCYHSAITGLSCIGTRIAPGKWSNIVSPTANGFGYAVLASRAVSSDLVADPRSEDWVVFGVKGDTAHWEPYNTHGGKDIYFIGCSATNVQKLVALVGCQFVNAGPAMIAPINCHAIGCSGDSGVDDGTAGEGIKFTGAEGSPGTPGSWQELATGSVVDCTLNGFGTDTNTNTGAILVQNTKRAKILFNELYRPAHIGVSLYYNNFGFNVMGNGIEDVWSNAQADANGVFARSDYNKGNIRSNPVTRGDKTATHINDYAVRNIGTANNQLYGDTGYNEATTAITGELRSRLDGSRASLYAGVTSVVRAAAIASPGTDGASLKVAVDKVIAVLAGLGATN